jgi:FtsX-like permease family
MSLLQDAWHVVLKRTRTDWLVLGAAALIVLLAVTLLSAGMIYGDAVALSSLHRSLQDAPGTQVDLQATTPASAGRAGAQDAAVRVTLDRIFAGLDPTIDASGLSGTFALPGQDPNAVTDLAEFAFFDDIDQHAVLIGGAWPLNRGPGTVEAAISEPVATTLKLRVGSTLEMQSRLTFGASVTVRIAGIYRIDSPSDPFWWNDPLSTDGVVPGTPYTYHGPFVVARDTFLSGLPLDGAQLAWRAFAAYDRLDLGDIGPLASRVASAQDQVRSAVRDAFALVQTGLPDLLASLERALLATRTSVLLITIQLAVLAGYALAMTAGLLVEQRRAETAMLRSRGADLGQVGALAFMEGLLFGLPIAVAGPYLASVALRGLNAAGPLASIGLAIDPRVTLLSQLVAAVAAAAAIAGLTIPALRSGRVFMEQRQERGRQLRLGAAQRTGLDLGLLVIAGIGLWQLQRYGAPLTRTVQGQLGIDPLLVAAPALGLLAGGVLALRIVPLVSRAVERVVTPTRGAVAPLGAWQLARRPGRYARAGLLLILALALGIFAAAYTSTWTTAQRDQAAFQVGADVRVTGATRTGGLAPIDVGGALAGLPGVTRAMGVERGSASLPRGPSATVLALDAAAAPRVVGMRADLAPGGLGPLMQALSGPRPSVALPTLPAGTRGVAITINMTFLRSPETNEIVAQPFGASVVLRDQDGLLYRVAAGDLPAADATTRLEVSLADVTAGATALPRGPLQVAAVEVWTEVPIGRPEVGGTAELAGFDVSLDGTSWRPFNLEVGAGGWQAARYTRIGVDVGSASLLPPAHGIARLAFQTGQSFFGLTSEIFFALQPSSLSAANVPAAIPAVVDQAFLDAAAARIGDTVPVALGGGPGAIRVAGSVGLFPTIASGSSAVLVDLPTLELARYLASGQVDDVGEWWLSVSDDDAAAALATLALPPWSRVSVAARSTRAAQLLSDPVAVGIIGALTLGVIAAAVFAAVGFAASSAISAAERLGEFALLRAVGLSRAQLSGWLALENALLVAMSVVAGTVIGLAISWAVLPSSLLAPDGSQPVPPPEVLVPIGLVLLLEASLLVVLALLVLGLTVFLRRLGLGAALRVGEE